MSEHRATVTWNRNPDEEFAKGRFSRVHTWTFDGGTVVEATAAPSVVPAPYSNAAAVDPEEAFVASLSSCHMLTFVFLASRKGFVLDRYVDEAVGVLAKLPSGERWISTVTLRPSITWSADKRPTPEQEAELHHDAHKHCFISNSVKTEVTIEGTLGLPAA